LGFSIRGTAEGGTCCKRGRVAGSRRIIGALARRKGRGTTLIRKLPFYWGYGYATLQLIITYNLGKRFNIKQNPLQAHSQNDLSLCPAIPTKLSFLLVLQILSFCYFHRNRNSFHQITKIVIRRPSFPPLSRLFL
jgi:hypothetical protein